MKKNCAFIIVGCAFVCASCGPPPQSGILSARNTRLPDTEIQARANAINLEDVTHLTVSFGYTASLEHFDDPPELDVRSMLDISEIRGAFQHATCSAPKYRDLENPAKPNETFEFHLKSGRSVNFCLVEPEIKDVYGPQVWNVFWRYWNRQFHPPVRGFVGPDMATPRLLPDKMPSTPRH